MAQSLKSSAVPVFLIVSVFYLLGFYAVLVHGLDVGLPTNAGLNLFKDCSRTCESEFCDAPPFLRYGKYCGIMYSGCPGEVPCDRLDACCMHHDQCIGKKGNSYLSQECNKKIKECVEAFRRSGAPSFKGSTCKVEDVVSVIDHVMDAAIAAGRVFGKP